jgi:hypothetical protein
MWCQRNLSQKLIILITLIFTVYHFNNSLANPHLEHSPAHKAHTPNHTIYIPFHKRTIPTMASGKATRVPLSDDEVDDILYLTRTNESAELQQYLTQLSQQHNCSIASLLESTIDEDNANTPFHYCAANGYAGKHFTPTPTEGEDTH